MASLIHDKTSKRLIFGIALVGFAIFTFGHHDILDARFFYTGEFAQLHFSLLNEEQAKAYMRTCVLDLVFIHFYSSLIWSQFSQLLGKSRKRLLALTPSGFDLVETLSSLVIVMTGAIPGNLDWLGYVTAAKWTTGAIVFGWWLLLFFKSRRQAHRSL